jgi:Carboxypeptidase regulatory-like domain/TonB dependent receptor
MRRSLNQLMLLSILALLCFGGTLAFGQGTSASLTGQITDATGAVVVGATATITNIGTNLKLSAISTTEGVYRIAPVPPGEYTLTVEGKSFERYVQKGIVLTANLSATQNIALKTGSATETIEVIAGTELINTTTAELGTTVNEAAVSQLPLNGRDPSSLVLLAPGITSVTQPGGQGGGMGGQPGVQSGFSFPTETGASASGGRQGSTYYILDGVPHIDDYTGLAAPFPNADATQEFRVITNNFSALYGFSPGAVVSIETKSGSNRWHGGAFEFLRNKALNASACYFCGAGQSSVDPLRRNQFGGYVGGPILKNKLFFFYNYQGTRNNSAANGNTTNTPTQAMLNGDFSGISNALCTGSGAPVGCPFATVGGKPNQVDPSLFNQAAVTIATTALPLGQGANGSVSYPGGAMITSFNEQTGRLDYNLSNSQRLSLVSFVDTLTEPSGDVKGNILSVLNLNPWSQTFAERMEFYSESLGHTWTVSPTAVNTISVFWTQMQAHNAAAVRDSGGQNVCWSRYINVTELPGQCFMEGFSVGGGGFNGGWTEPSQEGRTTYGLYENFSKTIGKHAISVGMNLQHLYAQEATQYPTNAIVGFSGQYTGNGLADFLLGYMSSFNQGAGEIAGVSGWQYGFYGQDQFRVRPNLSLTLGLRWEPNIAPPVGGGRGAAYVPGQQSTLFPNAPLGLVFPGDKGIGSGLMPNTYNYWEPRIGVAWQPRALPNTSIRAGFGIFTAPLMYSMYNHTADIAPFSPTYFMSGGANTPLSLSDPWSQNAGTNFQSPFPPFAPFKPASNAAFAPPFTIPAIFAQDFRLGTTQSWNVSVEHGFTPNMLLRVAYVGSESYHQALIIDQNPGVNNVRVNPNFFQILTDFSNGTASYNSLQVGVERKLSKGLQFQSNFTWSKTLDTASTANISFGNNWLGDPFDLGWNRGISSLNIPFIWVSNLIYTTPTLREHNQLIRQSLGGWEVSSIISLQSGYPFGISPGDNNSGSLLNADRADVVPGQAFNVRQGGKSHWLDNYFNVNAFVPNPTGTFGTSGKNMFQGPPIKTMDIAFAKNWTIVEGYKLQFRWEMFNAFNHPSFGNPNNTCQQQTVGGVTSCVSNGQPGSFGTINSLGPISPRLMQAALKFTF